MNRKQRKALRLLRRAVKHDEREKTHLTIRPCPACPVCGGEFINRKAMRFHFRSHRFKEALHG